MYVGAFGPITWDVLLLCALSYPNEPTVEQQRHMLCFIDGLMHVLPCPGCSAHATQYITTYKPNVASSAQLVIWVVDFHNSVNLRSDKRKYTVEEATQLVINRYLVDGYDMSRAQQIRKEDHAKITALEKLLVERPVSHFLYPCLITNIVVTIIIGLGLWYTFRSKK